MSSEVVLIFKVDNTYAEADMFAVRVTIKQYTLYRHAYELIMYIDTSTIYRVQLCGHLCPDTFRYWSFYVR